MSGQVTITQLPTASALTGSELVPVVQNGVTAQTTTGAISGAGALNYPFLTVGTTSGLTQARYLSTATGLSLSDTGAGGVLTINMTGAASSLNAASTGIIVKDSASTVASRSLAVGSGMTISNADGISGNPTFGLSTILQNLASATSAGMLALNGTTITAYTLQGVTSQTSITNGNGVSGAPTIGLATDPVMPGTGAITIPTGTTAQRSGSIAAFRYNSELGLFEGYGSAGWAAFTTSSSAGVVSVGTGTGLTGGPITSTGTISIANTTVAAGSYTYASITVNAQGQLTSASSGGTLAIAGGGTGQTSASAAFNALSPITTTGDLIIGNGTNSATRLAIGTNGYILTSNGTTASWTAASSSAVTTFSGGTTGLTPSSATAGAITLAGTLAVANGGTGVTTSSGASSVVLRDANGNITTNSLFEGFSSVAAAGTTTTLTVSSVPNYVVTGSGGQTFQLPDATTLPNGTNFTFNNNQSSGAITVNNNSTTLIVSVPSGSFVDVSLISNATAAGSWDWHFQAPSNTTWSTNTFTTGAAFTSSQTVQGTRLISTIATGTAPLTVASTTQVANLNAAVAGSVTLAAGTGATNYIPFSATATGNQPLTTNTLLTYNYTNNTITAGISGGAF